MTTRRLAATPCRRRAPRLAAALVALGTLMLALPAVLDAQRGPRILISLADKHLWLMSGRDTLFSAPVAIGMQQTFTYGERTWDFSTPAGQRRVIGKEPDPVWTPPNWHYYEKAVARGLDVVELERDAKIELTDGTFIVVLDDDVGRINRFGNFHPFTPGTEIIFDDTIFIPPFGTRQRRVPDALGPYKLDMGDGYLIHGTNVYTTDSIGGAVSHGCVRMNNSDISRLYYLVEPGTPVHIF